MAKSLDHPKVLLIDSYDSFTHNLAALIAKAIPRSEVTILRNDEVTTQRLVEFLPAFSAVVVGPGPGSPEISTDIGIVKDLWHLSEDRLLPIFGVCLGLQSLGVEFGARLKRLDVVKHGQISQIEHDGDALFDGVLNGAVVRYHSLHVEAEGHAPKLQEIAWADDGEENGGRVVMALKHKANPFWAVQYHPESVCTDGSGLRVLENFWSLAKTWWLAQGRTPATRTTPHFGRAWPSVQNLHNPSQWQYSARVSTSSLLLPQLSVMQICETMGVYKSETDFVLLDSAAKPGRYSIIGCLLPTTPKIVYYTGDNFLSVLRNAQCAKEDLQSGDIWAWLTSFMESRHAVGGNVDLPFWGGLVGYFSYEIGVQTMGSTLRHHGSQHRRGHPDVNLVFVERSIVVDNQTGEVFLQSLIPGDRDWFSATSTSLKRAAGAVEPAIKPTTTHRTTTNTNDGPQVFMPDKDRYIEKVKRAKESLFAGDSYELCVTARTRIYVPKIIPNPSHASSWDLYKRLHAVNPAPYAAYIRLSTSTLVSSSPERFLSYTRSPSQRCQLRPIKGTVRKSGAMTRAAAEEILSSPKEVAENLMIVDLIRHDLYGVLGNDVEVRKFCGIEEYETVYQLVSVIEGSPTPTDLEADCGNELGWEVLKRSLPPGSMTGAPKKRSVEILDQLEDDERSIYSGVVGFHCVSGSGDWSVIIRSCYNLASTGDDVHHAGDSPKPPGYDEWVLGAGGAITALSDPEAEWEEMIVKLQSALRAFRTDS